MEFSGPPHLLGPWGLQAGSERWSGLLVNIVSGPATLTPVHRSKRGARKTGVPVRVARKKRPPEAGGRLQIPLNMALVYLIFASR